MIRGGGVRKELEDIFLRISLTDPVERAISLLANAEEKERVEILKDGPFWLRLLCGATSLKFEHWKMCQMSLDEIGQLYLLFGLIGENPLEIVLGQVRATYLDLVYLEGNKGEEACDCFYILMSLYPKKKCHGMSCQVYCPTSCQNCREIYKDIGKHYGVSLFL